MNRMGWYRLATLVVSLALLPQRTAQAQGPAAPAAAPSVSTGILFACFVPSSGTVYRIKEPGLPDSCRGQGVEFSWNAEGQAGPQGPQGETGPPGPGADPAALTTLQNNIDAEAAARAAADVTLQSNIDAEAAARAQGDIDVLAAALASGGGNVGAEAAARSAADATLQSNIDAEAAARAQGDVDGLAAANTYTVANVSAEAAARNAADVTLQNNINAEAAARQAADVTLQNSIAANSGPRPVSGFVVETLIVADIPVGSVVFRSVTCPGGKTAISGGFRNANGTTIGHAAASFSNGASTWSILWRNDGTSPGMVEFSAVCVDAGP